LPNHTLTYAADVDGYVARLTSLGGDLPAFAARLREAAGSEDPRAALLARAARVHQIQPP